MKELQLPTINWVSSEQQLQQKKNKNKRSCPPHPDLQLYPLVVPVDGLDLEVDADRADKRGCEGVVCIAEEKGGLSNAAVPDDEDFKHVIKVLV